MAAPMVASRASTIRGKKGNKNYFPVKNTITSPFLAEWPLLEPEDAKFVLREVQSCLVPHAAILAKLPTKRKEQVDPEAKKKRAMLRSQLALGLNEVTRALERGQLRLALVCRTAQPALMINHLMALSATRNTPVACVHHLSDSLAPILQLKVILAIGFKKLTDDDPPVFDDLVNSIIPLTPPVHVPWLQYKELTTEELRKVVTNIVFDIKEAKTIEPKQKKKGKNKAIRQIGALAPDTAQAGTPNDNSQTSGNPESGASAAMQGHRQAPLAPEHGQFSEAGNNQSGGQFGQQPPNLSEEKSESHQMSAVKTSVPRTGVIPGTPEKRKLSGSPKGPSNKKVKTVLKPEYKPVTILPVKIIPKEMKGRITLTKKTEEKEQEK